MLNESNDDVEVSDIRLALFLNERYWGTVQIIMNYNTALLNAVERSIHLLGPSRLPVVIIFQ